MTAFRAAGTLLVDGRPTGIHGRFAHGFVARAVGLLRPIPAGRAGALLIPRCAAIHTFGMRRAIDVAFVDMVGRVLRVDMRLAPWRIAWCRGACSTWEFPAGEAELHAIRAGVRLDLLPDATVPAHAPAQSVLHASQPSATRDVDPGPRRRIASVAAADPVVRHAHATAGAPVVAAPKRKARVSMRGAAMLEFLVAAVLVLLPLTFATLELAQLAVTRHALDYASFEAARSGAVHGADRATMRRALARALAPLFAPVDPVAVLRGAGGPDAAGGEQAATIALARAAAEALRPDLLRIDIENPTAAAGRDFGVVEEGERVIPNDGLDARNPFGAGSGLSLREANVLAIRVRYCRRLVMPIVDRVVPAMLRLRLLEPFDQLCLAQGRVPIEAGAVVHMQSPVRVAQLDGG